MGDRLAVGRPDHAARASPVTSCHVAVGLYFRFPLSFRMVEEMLAARGILVSHEAVRQWASSSAKPLPTPSADAGRSRVTNGTWMKS